MYLLKNIKQRSRLTHVLIALPLMAAVVVSGYIVWTTMAATVPSVPQLSAVLPATEASGLAASRQYPGVMWWHRDGGPDKTDRPRNALYAVKFDANGVLQPVRGAEKTPFYPVTGPQNRQWEDVVMDDNNNVWIGEIGSNDCQSAQYLHKLAEPNLASTAATPIVATYSLKFPDPAADCVTKNAEAMFWLDGHMYVFSKEKNSPVYRVDLPAGASGAAKLTKLGELAGVNTISGSSISDDRKRMMVQHHQKFFVYTSGNPALRGDAYVKDMISRSYKWSGIFGDGTGTVEGGTFVRGSHNLAFVAESTEIYYAKPAAYGDTAPATPAATPPPAATPVATTTPVTTPAATPTPVTSSNCAVTSKLENPCRPWLGAAANRYPGVQAGDYRLQIEAHEKAIGRNVDFAHTYHPAGDNSLSANDKYFINRSNTYLFTNWKPTKAWKDAGGSNASINAGIDKMADSIKSVAPKKIMMTLNHEAENDVTSGASGCTKYASGADGGTPAEFKAMWANVQKRFAAKGANNVVWVADYMNYAPWDCMVDDLWPGNDRVDWVLFNAYGFGTGSVSDVRNNIQRFHDLTNRLQDKDSSLGFTSKIWGIAEWNTHDMPADKAYKYYDDMKLIANTKAFPRLKAYFVFDSIGPEGNNNRIADVWNGKNDSNGNPVYVEDKKKLQKYIDLAQSGIFKGGVASTPTPGATPTPTPTPAPTPAPDAVPPTMPGDLNVEGVTETTVALSWTASSDAVGVTGYRVRRNGSEVGRVAGTHHTDAGLKPGTAYSYAIDAYDATGNFSQAANILAVTKTPADVTPPAAPASLTAQAVSGSVRLSWAAATDNVGVTGYMVQRNDVTIAQLPATPPTYTDAKVLPSSNYTYQVRAVDAAGNTSAAARANVTTPAIPDATPPSVPADVAAEVAGQQVNLSWKPATDNVGVKHYEVRRNGAVLMTATTTSVSDATVTAGQTYSYTVTARDAAGNASAPSPGASVTVPKQSADQAATPGLSATFYPNQTLSGLGVRRTDAVVNFDWGQGAPAAGIPANNFSARWTGRITAPRTGTYTFYTQADDGVRLWVDDQQVIDDWQTHGVEERSGTVQLTAGNRYNIHLHYAEASGNASVKLLWSGPSLGKQVVPASQFVTSSYGLTGAYYRDDKLAGLAAIRLDAQVAFRWPGAPVSGLPGDHFSTRWTGKVFAPKTGTYTFSTLSNDGVRLWVNGKLLIDNWTNHGSTENSGVIDLTAGTKYDLKLEYYDNTGQGIMQLLWQPPAMDKQIIPEDMLHDR